MRNSPRSAPLALVVALTGCGTAQPANEAAAAPDTNVAAAAVAPAPSASPAAPVADPAASQVDFATLAGKWKVAGVAPGEGVQALATDDPAYMGRVVAIAADRLAWIDSKAVDAQAAGGATVSDRCDGPVTQRLTGQAASTADAQFAAQLKALRVTAGAPHAIECDTGNWGPEAAGGATLYAQGRDTLALSWYDGIVLKLVRDPAR